MNTKQVIILRKDLNMRKGKMVAQGAHASMKVILDNTVREYHREGSRHVCHEIKLDKLDEALLDWINGTFTKICVGVSSLDELHDVHSQAKAANLPCSIILDAGLTEFDEPTFTAVAIGPAESEEIDKITGDLKLL